jgi:hypothetical protein
MKTRLEQLQERKEALTKKEYKVELAKNNKGETPFNICQINNY